MREEVKKMERAVPQRRVLIALVALIAAIAATPVTGVTSPTHGSDGQVRMPWCPPAC
jgi:hypothetical protein